MDAEPGGGDLRGVTRDSSMDLASHHWSIWADLKSGRRRSGAEISAGSVEAAGRFRDVSYCSVDLPTLETARFSKSFSTVPHHHYRGRGWGGVFFGKKRLGRYEYQYTLG